MGDEVEAITEEKIIDMKEEIRSNERERLQAKLSWMIKKEMAEQLEKLQEGFVKTIIEDLTDFLCDLVEKIIDEIDD